MVTFLFEAGKLWHLYVFNPTHHQNYITHVCVKFNEITKTKIKISFLERR